VEGERMNIGRRIERIERTRTRRDPDYLLRPLEPATAEEAVEELAADVLHWWSLCRSAKRIEASANPEGRYRFTLWRPDREPGDVPTGEDVFLTVQDEDGAPWQRRTVPMPDDPEEIPDEADVCDVWTAHTVCQGWQWKIFQRTADRMPPGYLEALEPRPRPMEGIRFSRHSAFSRWTAAQTYRRREIPTDSDTGWSP
jgi:hypothetical protein